MIKLRMEVLKMNEENNPKKEHNWADAADDAEKRADEEVEKIKREAHEQLTNGKNNFNNPDDSK